DVLEVQLQANCRERDVFLIQPLVPPTQEHLVELLLMLDAARGASAARITVVMPHFARYDLSNTVVVSPDLGYAKEAAAFARRQAHRPVHRPRPRRGHAPHPLRRVGQRAVQYILMICPVTFLPWWEARNVITSATSSARAIRRSGLSPARASLESSPIHPVSVTGG